MKKVVLLMCLVLVGFSCTKKGEYTISGESSADGLEGKYIHLMQYNGSEEVEKSDSVLIKDGKFSFRGIQEIPAVYFLTTGEGENLKKRPLLVEAGQIIVKLTDDQAAITGTLANEAYQRCLDAQTHLLEKMDAVENKYKELEKNNLSTPEMKAAVEKEADGLYEQIKESYATYFVGNINNPLGQELFKSIGRKLSFEQLTSVMDKADVQFKASEIGIKTTERLDRMKKIAIGQPFVDFKSKNLEGKEVALSEYVGKGKYVLLDFWASWCPPCCKEMPNLVEIYKQYKDKNFEIVGYSLDKKEEDWKKGLTDLQMTWPQLSDLQYWQSEPVKIYAVQGIPHTILLDPNGLILEKNLMGDELLKKLQEVLK